MPLLFMEYGQDVIQIMLNGFTPKLIANESFVLFSETALKFFLNLFRSYQYDAIGNFISTNYEIEERNSSFTFIHQLSLHDHIYEKIVLP